MMFAIQTTGISNEQVNRMCDALERLGMDYSNQSMTFGIIPFTHKLVYDDTWSYYQKVIPFGSVQLVKMELPHNWKIFHNSGFEVEIFAPILGNHYLNADCKVFTVEEVLNYRFPQDIFIKPAGDEKQFDGTVLAKGNTLQQYFDTKTHEEFDLGTKCIVASVKNHIAEYRFWVVNGEIVEFSFYHGQEVKFNFTEAEKLIKLYCPAEAFVVDLSVFSDGTLKVTEYNCINCSGFPKDAKPEKVFGALAGLGY